MWTLGPFPDLRKHSVSLEFGNSVLLKQLFKLAVSLAYDTYNHRIHQFKVYSSTAVGLGLFWLIQNCSTITISNFRTFRTTFRKIVFSKDSNWVFGEDPNPEP